MKKWSRSISRVLSRTVIHLGRLSPSASSNLPGNRAGRTYGSNPLPPYLVLLRVGFALPLSLPIARCALTAPFHPYLETRRWLGGIFSVALSVGSRLPGVTWHPTQWSPDFPPSTLAWTATVQPTPCLVYRLLGNFARAACLIGTRAEEIPASICPDRLQNAKFDDR